MTTRKIATGSRRERRQSGNALRGATLAYFVDMYHRPAGRWSCRRLL
ncbi:hypothetical protein [Mycobacterium sp. AZCC_0083]|nr:hypothetical protein [Mycobacterium sp. AZCC_0083]MBB5167526.1 hypothetical protein [Mycobacterium sp. AZCC_0083]